MDLGCGAYLGKAVRLVSRYSLRPFCTRSSNLLQSLRLSRSLWSEHTLITCRKQTQRGGGLERGSERNQLAGGKMGILDNARASQALPGSVRGKKWIPRLGIVSTSFKKPFCSHKGKVGRPRSCLAADLGRSLK